MSPCVLEKLRITLVLICSQAGGFAVALLKKWANLFFTRLAKLEASREEVGYAKDRANRLPNYVHPVVPRDNNRQVVFATEQYYYQH
ncbi:hypothetical protein [Pseudomonas oryzihabitans]|uniref:Uncharacterized protein n=1 Tax=Pseudomonas oryzihabitans TaxID=47885 RepID=A0AAJ2EYH5_9PSED|nr:hypothetical protein [Pseudomonas psychrotolerans]MDR6236877.1 hypothetical protein [Pseudomonas psychrotolerans]MDR6353701.1 hypothetical protein [Pseudomonas psychrotolerans]